MHQIKYVIILIFISLYPCEDEDVCYLTQTGPVNVIYILIYNY